MTAPTSDIKQIIKEEYKRCAKDVRYFLTKYCYIQHPLRGKMLFNLYPYQRDAITQFEDNQLNIVLKARQIGVSTLVAGYSLWLMLFHGDKNILVLATKQETAKTLVTKVRVMHQLLPSWLKGTVKADNQLSLEFANGSKIKAAASSKDAGRSESLSLLIIDECAFIEWAEDIWTSAQATISTGGKAILISTPNGVGNFFHKMWVEASEGRSAFNPILFDWRAHPERDQAWRDLQDTIQDPAKARQEFDADFITTGNSVIPGETIKWYEETFKLDPKHKAGIDNNKWVWQEATPGKRYLVSADVARGDGQDYSAYHVLDIDNLEQVAEYRGHVDPKQFGHMLVSVATEYNDALLIIENASVGYATIQEVMDRDYRNLFYMTEDLKYIDADQQITNKLNRLDKKKTPGFTTSSRTRPLIISKLCDYMRERELIIRSERLLNELYTFIWKGGRAEASYGYNDDLVLAFCIGVWIRDTALRIYDEQLNLHRQALNGIHVSRPDAVYTPAALRNSQQNPYKMEMPDGQYEDLKWLLR